MHILILPKQVVGREQQDMSTYTHEWTMLRVQGIRRAIAVAAGAQFTGTKVLLNSCRRRCSVYWYKSTYK